MSLIDKILSGDEQAVASFYRLYAGKIAKFLRYKLPGEEVGEIVNDVFLDAIDALPTLHTETNLQAWLYKIAHNKIVDYYRKKKIKSILLSQIPFLEIIASEVSEPEFQMEKDKIRDRIEASMREISEKYRRILKLHYEDDMPIKQIALVLNMTPKATESLLFRARQSFIHAYERT